MLQLTSKRFLTAFIIILVILSFIFGLYGYMTDLHLPVDDALYKTLILYLLDADTADIPVKSIYINLARYLAPMSLFLGGTQIILYLSNDGVKKIRRSFYRNHYIVFGNGLQVKLTVHILRQQMAEMGKYQPIIVVGKLDGIDGVDIIQKEIFDPSEFKFLNLPKSRRIISLYEDELNSVMLVEALCGFINPSFVDVDVDSGTPGGKVRLLMRCNSDETEGLVQDVYRHKFGKFGTFKIVEESTKSLTQVRDKKILILGLGEIGRTLIEQLQHFNSIVGYDSSNEKVNYLNNLYKDKGEINCYVSKLENIDLLKMPKGNEIDICYVCGGDDNLKYKTALRLRLHFPSMDIIVLTRHLPSNFSILRSRNIDVFNYQQLAMENVLSKSNKILISVIIPAYNAMPYLDKCLESLSRVMEKNIEFIVVNDGSTDDTAEIIWKHMRNDGRFKLIDAPHQGVGAARNAGVINAKGSYVSFVDADDMVEPQMFEVLYRNALECNADITVCRAMSIDENGQIGQPLKCWNFTPGIYNQEKITNSDFLNNICSPVLWDKLIKREIAEKCMSPYLPRGQDFITLISMINASHSIRIIDDSLYYYRHHNKSTMAEPLSEKTIISDFNTENMAIELIHKYWANTPLEVSYRQRVKEQWLKISEDPKYLQFSQLISSKLSEVLK